MATTVLERLEYVLGMNMRDFNAGINSAQDKLKGMQKKMGAIGKKTAKIGAGMTAGMTLPILGLGGAALKASIDFETAFTGVKKTVSATEEEFEGLKKGILDMSERIPIAANDLAAIAEAAGQLGIQTDSILDFTEVMANLGATTNLTAEDAASMLAKFAAITGLDPADYENLGSTIVGLGNNFATTENDIVRMAMRLAGAGKTIGLSQADILSLSAALSSVGIEAEAGGTAFSQVMKKISKEVGSGSEKMAEFARISGQSVEEFETGWRDNAAAALISFTEGLARVQTEGENVNVVLDGLGFEGIRVSDSLLRAAGSGDLFREALSRGNEEWEKNTALTNEANLRYGTTASQMDLAKNKLINLAKSFGDVMAPALNKVLDALAPMIDWFKDLSPEIKETMIILAGLTAVIGPLLIGLGAIGVLVAGLSWPIVAMVAGVGLLTAAFFKWGGSIKDVWNWIKKLVATIKSMGGAIGGFVMGKLGIGGGGGNVSNTTNTSSTNVIINEQVSRSDIAGIVTESDRQAERE